MDAQIGATIAVTIPRVKVSAMARGRPARGVAWRRDERAGVRRGGGVRGGRGGGGVGGGGGEGGKGEGNGEGNFTVPSPEPTANSCCDSGRTGSTCSSFFAWAPFRRRA